MRYKRCKLCGCIIYDWFSGEVCDMCEDEREETEDNGTGENLREQDQAVSERP